jgi:hypothetical protein
MPTNRYKVLVDSHAQYQSESARYELGPFGDYQTAVEAARKIVDDYLLSAYRPGMTAEALFTSYSLFGEDPFIVPDDADPPFSAWTYAKARCQHLCAKE